MITRLVCCLFLQFVLSSGTMANISTACYGSPVTSCTEHTLRCPTSLVISITNITFGYRKGCSVVGVSSCVDTACCREETGDCFTPYNQTLLSQLQQTCNGRSTCTLNRENGLDEISSSCFNGIPIHQSYSKIEYQCTENTPPSTPQPTTETTSSTTTKIISNTISSNQASTDLANTQESKFSTACYGIPGIGSCTEHRLICTEPFAISITNITFGYRPGCSGQGISNCGDTTCCREEIGDCFTPYNQTLLSQLQQTCSGRSTCTLNYKNGFDEPSSYCFNGSPRFHSYSKIEYQCVTNVTESTTYNGEFQETTTSGESEGTAIIDGSEEITVVGGGASTVGGCNEIAVVGGVLGTVIVICIIIIVLLVIYFNRKLDKLKSELRVHHNGQPYDSAPNRTIYESSAGYNSLNTRQGGGYYNLGRGGQQPNTGQTNSSNNNQHSTIDGGDDHSNHNNQHYEHQYDEAPRGTTDQPAAVYGSLNTREQTGYYNMGNINTVGKDK